MGNKLSCSCAPLIRKAYRYEDSPWQTARRRDGHLLRLWAEVFHVSAMGNVKWQQVSEDLVPVNITCIQDTPECVFHITAYNSQVDKILDVRLVQPGTRLGQASECFVYWKDPATGDTWGLNFTSPVDAKQFRECCSPSFKFSRKALSSYSLKLEPPKKVKGKRKPLSTPSSPSRIREPQCTCMTRGNLQNVQRMRPADPRAKLPGSGASTIPRGSQPQSIGTASSDAQPKGNTLPAEHSNAVRKDLAVNLQQQGANGRVPSATGAHGHQQEMSASTRAARAAAALRRDNAKSVDYSEMESVREGPQRASSAASWAAASGFGPTHRRTKSKSSDDVFEQGLLGEGPHGRGGAGGGGGGGGGASMDGGGAGGVPVGVRGGDLSTLSLDSNTLKRMLQPMASTESGDESPGPCDRDREYRVTSSRYHQPVHHQLQHHLHQRSCSAGRTRGQMSSSFSRSDSLRSSVDQQSLYLELMEPNDHSPPSDSIMFDNQCYATTPSSSNGEGYHDERVPPPSAASSRPQSVYQQHHPHFHGHQRGRHAYHHALGSPTSRLLQEYEMHLRNALARGLDAESYSLHTFEALLTQSMENLEALISELHVEAMTTGQGACNFYSPFQSSWGLKADSLNAFNGTHWQHSAPSSPPMSKSSTLPLTHSKSGTHISSVSLGATPTPSGGGTHYHSFEQQASIESADSRLCYLTSSEISDDERMSLTTAVSEDEDPESGHSSPYKSRVSVVSASSFNCTGAVRKAGFLSVKKWLLRKKHQVELARKRGWKGYWVCLKGTTLLFYPCDNREGRAIDNTPKHLIIVDGAIMQPIPEHPKREYIFCLSTAFGDAYLFQAPCQVELENWVNSIHSACAAAFARHRGKTGTLHLLQEEIFRLDKETESDTKMRHMADLQLSVVSDADNRQSILNQICNWEENLERLHCEQFRLRCYMASLQNAELPNPKNLLAHVSRSTKNTLNRLGVFTVSSLHAYVSARSPSLLNNLLAGRGATKRRTSAVLSRSNSAGSRRSLSLGSTGTQNLSSLTETPQKVLLPDNRSATVYLRESMTTEELLAVACSKKQLVSSDHFLRFHRFKDGGEYYTPHRNEFVENLGYEAMEVCAKILYQVELSRHTLDQMWGFSVEAELVENTERQDELCVAVSRVEDRSLAMQQAGIMKGDEIMVINGAIVSDLDMMYIESVLQEELSLCMMMRSCRTEPPEYTNLMKSTDDFIEQLVCPPPPSDLALSEEMISGLIVPAPAWGKANRYSSQSADDDVSTLDSVDMDGTGSHPASSKQSSISVDQDGASLSSEQIENLLKVASNVNEYCRTPVPEQRKTVATPPPTNTPPSAPRQLSDSEKLRKVILELVDTERTYVKHLNCLLELYLEPLKKETFLSNAEINALFGNIHEIVAFQRVFLQSLEEALEAEPDFHRFEHVYQFKNVLFSLGGSFLCYANHFKLYSSFCASHSKAQKVLHPSEGNQTLQEFLQSRNPRQQHSSTLESYLIKPIQRILKYPLLLQQLKNLTEIGSDEHTHLSEALKGMEKVAEHINEMQRIHEEYGAIFDHLFRQHLRSSKLQHVDLSPGELLYYGGVEWLNIQDFLGKIKKGLELHAMCFVFKTAVVFLCKERIRQRKKLMGGSSKANHSEVEIIRYQVLIPVTEVQVRASSLRDIDSHFMWDLIHLKSQVHRRSERMYQLSNSTNEFRNAFLKTIRQIIRESVRNMSIPANKPLASRDKYSSGGGLLSATGFMSGTLGTPVRHSTAESAAAAAAMARTLSNKKKSLRATQPMPTDHLHRHSTAAIIGSDASLETYDNVENNFRTRNKALSQVALADGQHHHHEDHQTRKATLGKTPNHLSLSTVSTLSAGSSGSGCTAAKLIQASNAPVNYQPPQSDPPAGSPVWKPRDGPPPDTGPMGMVLGVPGVVHHPQRPRDAEVFVYNDYVKDNHVAMPSKQVDC